MPKALRDRSPTHWSVLGSKREAHSAEERGLALLGSFVASTQGFINLQVEKSRRSVPNLPAIAVPAGRERPPTRPGVRRLHRGIGSQAASTSSLSHLPAIRGLPPSASAPVIIGGEHATEIVAEMAEAVRLQSSAVCKLQPPDDAPAAASAAAAAGIRSQGGWETVRMLVSDDAAGGFSAIPPGAWEEIRRRCVARRLNLLIVQPREGLAADALPPAAVLQQLELGASANEGAPFVVCVTAPGSHHWEPPGNELLALKGQWVHGLSLRAMEAFDAACRLRSKSVMVVRRSAADGGGEEARAGRRDVQALQHEAIDAFVMKLLRKRLPASHFAEGSAAYDADGLARAVWALITARYPAAPGEPDDLDDDLEEGSGAEAEEEEDDGHSIPRRGSSLARGLRGGFGQFAGDEEGEGGAAGTPEGVRPPPPPPALQRGASVVARGVDGGGRGHWTASGSGAGATGAGAAAMPLALRRVLWRWQRQQAGYVRRYTQASLPLLGREVELLEALQIVSAMAGLAAPEVPGVPDEATRRPSGMDFEGARRVPLLMMAASGTGKTHLTVRLLQRLGSEWPQVRVAAHFAAAGGEGFDLARVALTHLIAQLYSIILQEEAGGAGAGAGAGAADAARREPLLEGGAAGQLPRRLPARYEDLCALCRQLIGRISQSGWPLLLVLDGIGRIFPPLSGAEALGWIPHPLPHGVCVLLLATAPADSVDEVAARREANRALEAVKAANAVHADRLRAEAAAATEAAELAEARALQAPVLSELRRRRPQALRLRIAPLPTEAARSVLSAHLLRHAGQQPTARQLQPLLARAVSHRPLWLVVSAQCCGRALLSERLHRLLDPGAPPLSESRREPVFVRRSSCSSRSAAAAAAELAPPAPLQGEAAPSGAAGGKPAADAEAEKTILRAVGKRGELSAHLARRMAETRGDETAMLDASVTAMVSQAQRVSTKDDARHEQKLHDAPPVRQRPRDHAGLEYMERLEAIHRHEEEQRKGKVLEARADECSRTALHLAVKVLRYLGVSEHGLGLSEYHTHELLSSELPIAGAGACWTLVCQYLSYFLPTPACGVWSVPHAAYAAGLKAGLVLGLGEKENVELADYFVELLDPEGDASFVGRNEPHALLVAPYHLLRAGADRLGTLLELLRSPGYARLLVETEHTPPLPLMLVEILCRGEAGTKDEEMATMLEPEFGAMLTAAERDDPPEQAAERVRAVLARVARRLELARVAADKKAEARRNESEMRAGLSDKDRAAIRIQHHARAVSKFKKIKERQLVEADEKKRRASKLMEERQRVMTAEADARRRSTPDMFKNMPPPKSGGSGSIGLGTPPKTGSTGVSR